MAYDMKGQVAVVTGAAGELGRAITRGLLACDATVLMLDSNREGVATASSKLSFGAGQPSPYPTDITNEEQVRQAFEFARNTWGRVDLLVNNASRTGPTAPLTQISLEDWDLVMKVNLAGAFLCAREALKMMVPAKRGKIINISSIAGKIAYPLRAPYCSSKWGLLGLTVTLAYEYGEHNIQVNAICPGPIIGKRMEQIVQERAMASAITLDQARSQFVEATALRRFVKPEDVASLVIYLASPAGDNITGEAMEIDAGWGAVFR